MATKLTEAREDRLERRQARCQHSWKHVTETVNNRLVASTWCRKCMLTAHAFAQQSAGRASSEKGD
jgi:hypothetical protein